MSRERDEMAHAGVDTPLQDEEGDGTAAPKSCAGGRDAGGAGCEGVASTSAVAVETSAHTGNSDARALAMRKTVGRRERWGMLGVAPKVRVASGCEALRMHRRRAISAGLLPLVHVVMIGNASPGIGQPWYPPSLVGPPAAEDGLMRLASVFACADAAFDCHSLTYLHGSRRAPLSHGSSEPHISRVCLLPTEP